MRNYPLRNKDKQAAKLINNYSIFSPECQNLSPMRHLLYLKPVFDEYKLSDMAYISLRKDVYILFYINFKQIEENVKKTVNYYVKKIALLFNIRIASMPFNSKET